MSQEAESAIREVRSDVQETRHRAASSLLGEARRALDENYFRSAEKLATRAETVAEIEELLQRTRAELDELRDDPEEVERSGDRIVDGVVYDREQESLFFRQLVSNVLVDGSEEASYSHVPTPDELSEAMSEARRIRSTVADKRETLERRRAELADAVDVSADAIHISAYKLCSDDPVLRDDGAQGFLALTDADRATAIRSVPLLSGRLPEAAASDRRVIRALDTLVREEPSELLSTAPQSPELFARFLDDPATRAGAIDALEAVADTDPEYLETAASDVVSPELVETVVDAGNGDIQQARAIAVLVSVANADPTRFEEAIDGLVSEELVDALIDRLQHADPRDRTIDLLGAVAESDPERFDEETMSSLVSALQGDPESIRRACRTLPHDLVLSVPELTRDLFDQLNDGEHRDDAIATVSTMVNHSSGELDDLIADTFTPRITELLLDELRHPEESESRLADVIETLSVVVREFSDQLDGEMERIVSAEVVETLIDHLRDDDDHRKHAVRALSTIVEKMPSRVDVAVTELVSPEITDSLVRELDDEPIRPDAITVLARLAEEDPDQLEHRMADVVAAVEDDPDAIRQLGRDFPLSLVTSSPSLVEELLGQLEDQQHRAEAISILADVAMESPEMIGDDLPAITAALGDEQDEVRLTVCRTLKRIGSDDAIERLRDARREVRDYELRTEIEQLVQEAEREREQATADASEIRSQIPQPDTSRRVSRDTEGDDELPEHEVLDIIGSGGNAQVKKVRLDRTDSVAALKIPHWQGTLSESVVDEFRTEAATWSRIDDHENIIDVLGSGAVPHPWILLDYVPDGNLRDRLDGSGVEPATARDHLVDLCEAIRHAHRHGIVHADLKPENVLFDGDTPKVGDWGLAKVLLEHSTSIEGMTPSYAAPEQLNPDQYGGVDDATDVYQLGVVAYEMLTGRAPYDRDNPAGTVTAILTDAPTPPSERNPDLPDEVDDVVLTAMEKDKDDRYESILYFRDELGRVDV